MELGVGAIVDGKVTGITKFGAFVALPDGRSGLVHISEIAYSYVNEVSDHLHEGQEVKVKIIGLKDGKISLSMKALEEVKEEPVEKVHIPKSESIGTSLGDLFKGIKLD